MAIKTRLRSLMRREIDEAMARTQQQSRSQLNVQLALSAMLGQSRDLAEIRQPVAYVDFLRSSIDHSPHSLVELKNEPGPRDVVARRFELLVSQLKRGLTPVEFPLLQQIALIADGNRALAEAMEFGDALGDVGLHFELSSSFGSKGRLLYNVVRFLRCERCLELGTAYGMSAMFLLAALKKYAKAGSLTSVEGWEPMYSISSTMLHGFYGDMVFNHFGRVDSVLPELAQAGAQFDFLFHDAGHLRQDYVNDFAQGSKMLAPGAVVLFDDIRWEDQAVHAGATGAYEGWREVVGHSRVRRALEIDKELGLLLLN